MPRKARSRSLSSTSPATLPNSIPTNRYGTMPKLGWRSGLSRLKRSSKRHCSRSYCLFSVQPDSYSHSSNSQRLSTPQVRSSADTCATVDSTMLSRLVIPVLLLSLCSCSNSEQSRGGAMTQFVDDYFNAYFEWNPSAATSVGFHQYDGEMEDYSAAAVSKRIQRLKQLQSQISGLPSRRTPDEEIDIEILAGQIPAELLER